MTRLDAILLTVSLTVGIGGALYGMHRYAAHADLQAMREVTRQKSLSLCDEAGRGYLYRDAQGYVWCTLYKGEARQ